ncbi:protein-glutamine gamma-glutamyltransferase [Cohnella caldifontis]|uniref:protein-glutamine gamma-glutamyltransferase n=1 Tax=Cohnella caldifontis TaxID=3027471 RepID=UPI0023ECED77|nr:protein-glutamine gamma-glutamyltransferase [Cohnella sp. YIM B05605]
MIEISGTQTPVDTTTWSPLAAAIYARKWSSRKVYRYSSVSQLRFEMEARTSIVAAAEEISGSGIRFADFRTARCNERFWTRTPQGGFRIREDVPPSAGIRDIFSSGWSYATECSTATSIVVYKGVLDVLGDPAFNRLFAGLLLYNWHVDSDLRLTAHQGNGESYPGDLMYVNNPDFNPETPQWRGENLVKIGDEFYYGHPVGIVPLRMVIDGLNGVRRPGSLVSAYLTDEVVEPDYRYLSQFAPGMRRNVSAHIGGRRYGDPPLL